MSKKYVPPFLRDQTTSNTPPINTSFRSTPSPLRNNRFAALAALADDPITEKPSIKPDINAPKLVPATLASITSSNSSKISFASKFTERMNSMNDPKPINFESEDDFPSLGGATAKNVVVMRPTGTKFADMAKRWAKDEEDALKKAADNTVHREADVIRVIPNIVRNRRKNTEYKHNEDNDDYNANYEESSLGGDDSDEVPEGDLELSDEDLENQEEYNGDVGWDGRKRGDLY